MAYELVLEAQVGFRSLGTMRKSILCLGKSKNVAPSFFKPLPRTRLLLSQNLRQKPKQKPWYILLSPAMWPSPGLSRSIPNHFTNEKMEAQTEVLRLECKLGLYDPDALKCGALRMPEQKEGVHLNLRLSTAHSKMGGGD